jgi:hypothetical protein
MNNKIIIAIIAVLVVGAIGYFAFMQNTPSTVTPTEETPVGADAPQGKLNINVICEGALAYMSFTDGAAAEKFVAECKAGEHPEVIEKYKADMNLGDGAQI